MPAEAVYVGRPSRWGNPFNWQEMGAAEAVSRFRAYIQTQPQLLQEATQALAGRPLACWCPLGQPCHADVLLELVNQSEVA